MADADGKMTGRPGVAFVTRGPGATNASAGVHVAFQDSTPMILFVGDVARGDRDREGFQEIDFPAFFAPHRQMGGADRGRAAHPRICRARLPRRDRRAAPARWCSRCPRTCCATRSRSPDRPCVPPLAEAPDPGAVQALFELLKDAADPVAIVGGADWSPRAAHHFANFAFRYGIPVAAAFRRQDAICNTCQVYAGNLGYGPNPKLQQRIRDADLILAVGPRLGEATTDGYTLITPDHPGQTLVHVHPDPNELGRVYHADLPICADMGEFAEMVDEWIDPDLVRFSCGEEAHRGMARLVRAQAARRREARPRPVRRGDARAASGRTRSSATAPAISPAGGTATGATARCRRSSRRPAARWAMASPPRSPPRCASRTGRWSRVAGDGDFLMNGQELATAAQYGADLLVIVVDNGSYGTIRMHQEREYPERISATELKNPDFAALARAYGGWAETVETTEDFAPALDEALEAQRHPPAPLQDRRRADQQRDHDLQAAREGESLKLFLVRSIGRGNFDWAKKQTIDLRPSADVGPPFRHAFRDRKRDRRPLAEMLDEVVEVGEAAV